jgi:amino-acid N-acetyltransferase
MALVIEAAREADIPSLFALLQQLALPTDGLCDHLSTVLVAREGGGVIGSAALECYGSAALLRSVAVVAAKRGHGLGERLTRAALDLAQARGITEVYLLTETAQHYFPRFGFQAIPRQAVSPAIHHSVEWTSVCPETAQAMLVTIVETAH